MTRASALLRCGLFFGCVSLLASEVARSESTPVEAAEASAADVESSELLRYGGIDVRGLDDAITASASKRVSIWRLKDGTSIRPHRWRYLLRRLPRELGRALEPFGYYNAAWTITPQRVADTVSLQVDIELGNPVKIRNRRLRVEGEAASDKQIGRRLLAFKPAEGEALRHAVYEASKAEISRALTDRGYFEAELQDARVEVTRSLGAADIDLRWKSGPRYRFGAIDWRGNHLDPALLPPLVPFEAQGKFHLNRLLQLQQRLAELDYFSRIHIQPHELTEQADQAEPKSIGIEVELAPAPRNAYRTGASFGTDTGFAVNFGYDRRWVNTAGHKFQSDLLLGEERSALKTSYRIPAFERFSGWWVASLSAREEPFADLRSDVVEAAVQREAAWRGNRFTGGLHLHRERFAGEGETLIYPQVSLGRTVSNDPLYPTRGFSWNVLARWALDGLGSEVGFAQWQADATLIRGIGEHDRLILRGAAGAIHSATASLENIPPSFRFYAGGDRSVRGYGYQELGPLFEGDIRVGAARLITSSVEWEHLFTPEWGAAVFVDAGNAFGSTFDPAVGIGVGLRWRSPVGPVKVDLARGLDEPERSFRLHIQLGPEL